VFTPPSCDFADRRNRCTIVDPAVKGQVSAAYGRAVDIHLIGFSNQQRAHTRRDNADVRAFVFVSFIAELQTGDMTARRASNTRARRYRPRNSRLVIARGRGTALHRYLFSDHSAHSCVRQSANAWTPSLTRTSGSQTVQGLDTEISVFMPLRRAWSSRPCAPNESKRSCRYASPVCLQQRLPDFLEHAATDLERPHPCSSRGFSSRRNCDFERVKSCSPSRVFSITETRREI